MKPVTKQGKLVSWKDDRGFGFIQPDDGSQTVFLHISAIQGAGRRPTVGDRIHYESVVQADGKLRAVSAFLQTTAPRSAPTRSAGPTHQPSKKTASTPQKPFTGTKSNRPKPNPRKSRQNSLISTLLGLLGLVAIAGFVARQYRPMQLFSPSPSAAPTATDAGSDCVIKGNISIDTGAKLYHLPGMRDYDITEIDPLKGERWFCSEADAIAQGWHKAGPR